METEVKNMGSLYAINREIAALQSSIYSFNTQIQQKRDDLERLENVRNRLMSCQQEFTRHERLCLSPELSPNTWYGQLAMNFQHVREGRLKVNYRYLMNTQLEDCLQKIAERIEMIKQAIANLAEKVSYNNSKLYDLYADRRKELTS